MKSLKAKTQAEKNQGFSVQKLTAEAKLNKLAHKILLKTYLIPPKRVKDCDIEVVEVDLFTTKVLYAQY